MDRGGNPAGPEEGGAIKRTKEWKGRDSGGWAEISPRREGGRTRMSRKLVWVFISAWVVSSAGPRGPGWVGGVTGPGWSLSGSGFGERCLDLPDQGPVDVLPIISFF